MATSLEIMTDLIVKELTYAELEIKYGISQDDIRGRVSRAWKLPALLSQVLTQLTQNPSNSDGLTRQHEVTKRSLLKLNGFRNNLPSHVKGLWISDIHIPYQNPDAMSLMYQLIPVIAPDYITVLNDFFDMKAYGRWDDVLDANTALWYNDFNTSLKVANHHHTTLKRLAPQAHLIAVEGNHDAWLYRHLRDNPNGFQEANIADYMEALEKQGVLLFGNRYPVAVGRWRLIHGEFVGSNQNIGTKTRDRCIEDNLISPTASGHVHRDFVHGEHHNFGCLCLSDMSYLKTRPHWDLGIGILHEKMGHTWAQHIKFTYEKDVLMTMYEGRIYSVPRTVREWGVT